MGIVKAEIQIRNPQRPDLAPMNVEAVADTGALLLCIPSHLALQLQLATVEQREVRIADGSLRLCPYVGPVHLRFANRGCFTGALVLGEQVLLGAVPMEDMDLVVISAEQKVVVNPASPNFATAQVMVHHPMH